MVMHDAQNGKVGRTPENDSSHLPVYLCPAHYEELRASGLNDETIKAAGAYTEYDPKRLSAILNGRYAKKRGQALVFPFHDSKGEVNGYKRVKPVFSRVKDGKTVKYESPRGHGNRAYFPPAAIEAIRTPKTRLLITEGEKKSLKATQDGFSCTGLVGVYGWKRGDGADRLIHDLEAVTWKGREVVIVFDSDLAEKPEVRQAEARLAVQLKNQGATVRVARLPSGPEGEKQRLDDFLVRHGADDLHEILNAAEEPEEPAEDAGEKEKASSIDPYPEAYWFLQCVATHNDQITLKTHRGTFWAWDGKRYRELTEPELRSRVYQHLDPVYSHIRRDHISNVVAAVEAHTVLSPKIEPPLWLNDRNASRSYIAIHNGILDVEEFLRGGGMSYCRIHPIGFHRFACLTNSIPRQIVRSG